MVSSWALTAPPSLPSSNVDDLRVRDPVDLVPHRLERRAGQQALGLGVREALDPLAQGHRQRGERVGDAGRHVVLLRQHPQRLEGQCVDVEVLHDRDGHLVGDGRLDVRVVGDGGDRLDVPVGVGEDGAGPDGGDRQRRQHAGEGDQHPGRRGPPRGASVGRLRPGCGPGPGGPLCLQLGHPGSEPVDLLGVAHGGAPSSGRGVSMRRPTFPRPVAARHHPFGVRRRGAATSTMGLGRAAQEAPRAPTTGRSPGCRSGTLCGSSSSASPSWPT